MSLMLILLSTISSYFMYKRHIAKKRPGRYGKCANENFTVCIELGILGKIGDVNQRHCCYDSGEKSTNRTFEVGIGGRTSHWCRDSGQKSTTLIFGTGFGVDNHIIYVRLLIRRRRRSDTCVFIFNLLLHIHLYMIIFISFQWNIFHSNKMPSI